MLFSIGLKLSGHGSNDVRPAGGLPKLVLTKLLQSRNRIARPKDTEFIEVAEPTFRPNSTVFPDHEPCAQILLWILRTLNI